MELNTKPSKMWRIYLDIEEEELIWGLRGQRISPIRLMDLTEKCARCGKPDIIDPLQLLGNFPKEFLR